MSDTRTEGAGRLFSALAPREWSLRRKVALAVLIPIALAAVFGGLRVRNDLAEADSYSASSSQVTVLRPAVAYLASVESAIVVARQHSAVDDPARDAAIEKVVASGADFDKAVKSADLTKAQKAAATALLDRSAQLRASMGYASINQSVSQLSELQTNTASLIDTIIAEQREPELRLELLGNIIDGRVSLALQQFAVAYQDGKGVKPVELAAEVGAEASAIDRLAAVLGTNVDDPAGKDVSVLRAQNAIHFGTVRDGGTDLGDETAYAAYDRLSTRTLDGIDKTLASQADEAQRSALVDAAITLAALVAAIFLALLVSRLLLDPIRRVREGALEVAQEKLPEAVRRIRAGGTPEPIVPIPVTTHEEMGQLARAVDDLHREAVSLASGEAMLREQVSQMFQTLSRRSTSLVNQQLGLIETLEKDEEDPKRLESLFRLDHLASRMRRTADSLNVLADAPPAPSDPNGLSVSDVLHASISGVQEYQRVEIDANATERVSGAATTDVVHLVTELIDNALNYSPPNTQVVVTTKRSPEGVVIKVADAGLGMQDDAMAALNDVLKSGGEVNEATARRMGLLVVGRLAKRHGMFVELERNIKGGVTASVVLPASILRLAGQTMPPRQATPLKPVPTPVETPERATSALAAFTSAATTVEETAPAEAPDAEVVEEPTPEPAPEPAAPAAPAASGMPALPVRQRADAPAVPAAAPAEPRVTPAPAAGLAARLQSMREAREAAGLSNAPASRTAPTPAAPAEPATPKAPAAKVAEQSTESIEAAINAVIRLPQRRPGTAELPGGEITPLSQSIPKPAPVAAEPVAAAPAADFDLAQFAVVDPEPVAEPVVEPVVEPVAEAPVETPVEPVVAAPVEPVFQPVVEHVEPEPVSPIPAAVTEFHILDSQAPMPELVDEATTIFASMKSNWFNSDGAMQQPWSGNEIDDGWEAADRVAEAAPLQVSESGLPVRRPGTRNLPGGVSPAAATLVRDPEAIRARLSAHAAGVNRGRRTAGGAQAAEALSVDSDHDEHHHSQEVDPA